MRNFCKKMEWEEQGPMKTMKGRVNWAKLKQSWSFFSSLSLHVSFSFLCWVKRILNVHLTWNKTCLSYPCSGFCKAITAGNTKTQQFSVTTQKLRRIFRQNICPLDKKKQKKNKTKQNKNKTKKLRSSSLYFGQNFYMRKQNRVFNFLSNRM